MSIVVFTVIVFVLLIGIIKLSIRPRHFPPGPRGWPLFGNVSLLWQNEPIYLTLQKLGKTYGSVTGFYLGPTQPFISVIGRDAVKETLLNEYLNSRPTSAVLQSRSFGEKLGLIFVDGLLWQEQRRFTLRHLRDLGFGKTCIEDQMMDEIRDLIRDMTNSAQSNADRVVEFRGTFTVSVVNILWAIIAGQRFQRDDAALKKLLENVDLFLKSGNIARTSLPVPEFLVRHVPIIPALLGVDTRLFQPLQQLIQETIDEHLTSRPSKDGAPRDFLDVYLDEIKEKMEKNESTTFNRKQLVGAIQDLFIAGADTSSSAIGFAILYLIHHQQVQRRMQQELDRVCGDNLPSLANRSSLPYTEAVLMEVLRMSSIAPIAVPHYASCDTTIQGFHIPKGSIVAVNLDSIFKDEDIWKDPYRFEPDRHIDQDGKFVKNENLIPFGLGKRTCLGERLAKNTFFLFVSALVKTFQFEPVVKEPLPSLTPVVGFLLGPRPFRATVVLRSPDTDDLTEG